MRAAPAVQAVLGTGRPERMLISLLHAAAGVSLWAWLALHAEWPLAAPVLVGLIAAAVLMALLGAWLARRALPPVPGWLRWDGQAWFCSTAGGQPLQRLVVALDLGPWLLLRLHPAAGATAGRPLWRVASAGAAGPAWHGLRVALAAHAGASADVAGGAAP